MTEDPTHLTIIIWTVGAIVISGGSVLGIVKILLRGKMNRPECNLIHAAVSNSLDDIKKRLEGGDKKMDGMKESLVKISTILEERSKDETKRYDRHSEGWKDK